VSSSNIDPLALGAAVVLSALVGLFLKDALAQTDQAPQPLAAQVTVAPKAEQGVAPPPKSEHDATATRIVAVEWRIKKGQENEFLEYWSTRSTIPDRSGLVAEFLNRVESREQFPWMVWEFNEGWTTFINVGIWREGADFHQQIGRFIDNSRPPLAFEADKRRRVFLAPERWRIGNTPLLKQDHAAVR
jgi:hypothetical protein